MPLSQKEYRELSKNTFYRRWLFKYNLLVDFKKKFGRFPKVYETYLSEALGTYAQWQRIRYRKGIMKLWQYKLLDEIGFKFEIRKPWEKLFFRLKKFWSKNPHLWPIIPYNSGPELDYVRRWATHQRVLYRQNRLSADKIKKLKSIDFPFRITMHDLWVLRFYKLKKFLLEERRWPKRYSKDIYERKLALWRDNQRAKLNDGRLDSKKIKMLKSIKFSSNLIEDKWFQRYEELKSLIKKNNRFPNKSKAKGLSSWIRCQRDAKKRGTLSEEKSDLLEKIGFIWDPFEELWQKKYKELELWIKKYKTVVISGENVALSNWCNRQRTLKREGKLSKDKIQLLEKRGFLWDPEEEKWAISYHELKEWIKEHKTFPTRNKNNTLVGWCSRQRTSKSKNRLSKDKIKLLERIGFIWDPKKEAWLTRLKRLNGFVKKNARIPVYNFQSRSRKECITAAWHYHQKMKEKKGELDKQRIELLKKAEQGRLTETVNYSYPFFC